MLLTRPPASREPEVQIDSAKLSFSNTIRRLDPNGRVFFYQGRVLRGIYPDRVRFVRRLFDTGLVDELVSQNLLVGTRISDFSHPDFGLVLEHERLDFTSQPEEWSIGSFKQGATTTLDLLAALFRHNLTLVDAHNKNLSFLSGGKMIWHDFGSIVKAIGTQVPAIDEFLAHFYFPLQLYRRTGDPKLIRRLGMRVTANEFDRLVQPAWCSLSDQLASVPGCGGLARLLKSRRPSRRCRKLRLAGRLRAISRTWKKEFARLSFAKKYEVMQQLRRGLEAVKIRKFETLWSDYHQSTSVDELFDSYADHKNPRQSTIESLLAESGGDRVLDLGANRGLFSHLAYRHCDCVISADVDESAVEKHLELLQDSAEPRRVYPMVLDVTRMNSEVASRLKSHTVLALALTHHLRLGQDYPFSFIARQLSSVTGKRLITEFMPNGLGARDGPSPDPLPTDYTLPNFLAALKNEFDEVKVVDYERSSTVSPRILIVCDRKIP